jgi:hypothetical protein
MAHIIRKASVALVAIAATIPLSAAPPAAAATPAKAEQHCAAAVVGQEPDGQYVLGPVSCYSSVTAANASLGVTGGGAIALSMTLAVHYDGPSWTGSSFSVSGIDCTNGYINLPPSWDNRISSTWGACYRTRHYTGANLTGSYYDMFAPGTLPPGFDNAVSSVQYIGF